jgi:acetoin utilization deacetylase AcuC-like enzyme
VTGHLAGGTHHAFHDRGEGYCIFNDIGVAANVALRDYPDKIQRILVVDLDVHQGNGTAALFADDARVFTFSLHCRRNLFSERQVSNLDVDLEAGAGDAEYHAALMGHLPQLLDGTMAGGRPDLVFFQAGVDISEHDRLGHLNVTERGLRRRNFAVLEGALERGIPTVVTMGGGYPKNLDVASEAFQKTVKCHADVYFHSAQALACHQMGIKRPAEK